MRRLAVAVSMLLVAACSRPPSEASGPRPVPRLQAGLVPPMRGFGLYVNQPAYLALFDITPGAGIGLVYPQMGRELHSVVQPGPRWLTRGAVPYMPANYVEPVIAPVHYFFLVASRRPLNIDEYVGYPDYLREKLGNVTFTGSAFHSMKALVEEVVPVQPAEDWTTAVYLVYGGTGLERNDPARYVRSILQLVVCGSEGYWVPVGQGFSCDDPRDAKSAKDVLVVPEPSQPENSTGRRRDDVVMMVDPATIPTAREVVRVTADKVWQPPMTPTLSSSPGTAADIRRPVSEPRSSPVLSGTDSYVPSTTSSSTTVERPAQSPDNAQGRVSETSP